MLDQQHSVRTERGQVLRGAWAGALAVVLLTLRSVLGQDAGFQMVVVDANPPQRPWYKMAGDLDGDGDIDLVVGGARGPLVWYAAPEWTRAEIAAGGWDGVNGETGDLDGDGDLDIVMGGVAWFENPRVGGGEWSLRRIDRQKAHDVELGDVDGDGRLDVVTRDQSAFGGQGNRTFVYTQTAPESWMKNVLTCPHGEGLKLADLDGDDDLDIVIGGLWFENRRSEGQVEWSEHTFTTSWTEPDTKVEVADFNSDSRPDIILTPAELKGEMAKVAWYEGPRDPKSADWAEHIIVPEIECVIHSLGVGDFDRDGGVDIAIAEMHQGADPDEVSVYFNEQRGRRWRQQVLSQRGSHDLLVIDVGKDGDPDIIGANHAGGYQALELWENLALP